MTQPIGPIPVQAPVPSILTTARNRTADDFGESAPPPAGYVPPEGALAPSRASWRNGLTWSPACQVSGSWEECPDPLVIAGEGGDVIVGWPEKDAFSGTITAVQSWPFWIYTPIECEWVTDRAALESMVRGLNDVHAAYRMARAVWMGEGLPDRPEQMTLRRSATDISVGGAAADLDDAVASLIAQYETGTGGNGGAVLHIPTVLITAALGGLPGGGKIATPEGNVYRGPSGSLISPGPGYPYGASVEGPDGYGPLVDAGPPEVYAGNASDEVWIYISGPVEYAMGDNELLTAEGSILRRNVYEALAERQAIFRFDPCSVWAAKANNVVTLGAS